MNMKNNESITVSNDGEHWECPCGNNTMASGFDTCDHSGKYIEPLADVWTGLYACLDCGRVIEQDTQKVVSKNRDLSSFGMVES